MPETQVPSLGFPSIIGRSSKSTSFSLLTEFAFKTEPVMSSTWPERSLIFPSLSRTPGRSFPNYPKRNSFIFYSF